MSGIREVIAVVVAADSPIGQLAEAIDDLAGHLPSQAQPLVCPLCLTQPWPCLRFGAAAHRVQAAGLRLAELVPQDLHPHLWPRPSSLPELAAPAQPGQLQDPWFEERRRG